MLYNGGNSCKDWYKGDNNNSLRGRRHGELNQRPQNHHVNVLAESGSRGSR